MRVFLSSVVQQYKNEYFVITMSDVFENVMELAKRRGFIWPTSECYGAVAGFIDYGPLGAMMKRRVENVWRDFYVIREGYYEIECPTIAQEAVFIASGHERHVIEFPAPDQGQRSVS